VVRAVSAGGGQGGRRNQGRGNEQGVFTFSHRKLCG
jgi:hypothetical protein